MALQAIQPQSAELTVFFDPETLAPVEAGGNQLIFISFADDETSVYGARAATTTWEVSGVRQSGVRLEPLPVAVTGVVVSDLASVAGEAVNGAGGSLTFVATEPADPRVTRAIFFTQALGSFGAGHLLPR